MMDRENKCQLDDEIETSFKKYEYLDREIERSLFKIEIKLLKNRYKEDMARFEAQQKESKFEHRCTLGLIFTIGISIIGLLAKLAFSCPGIHS